MTRKSSWGWCLAAFVSSLIGGCAAAYQQSNTQPAKTEITAPAVPAKAGHPGIFLPVEIDGLSLTMIVDTAASSTFVFRSNDLQNRLLQSSSGKPGWGHDAIGKHTEVVMIPYDQLRIAAAATIHHGQLTTGKLDPALALPFDGLLGVDLLRTLRAAADFDSPRLILSQELVAEATKGSQRIAAYIGHWGFIYVEGTLGNQRGVFLLDSGANLTTVKRKWVGEVSQHKTVETASITGALPGTIGRIDGLHALGRTWPAREMGIVEDFPNRPPPPNNLPLLGIIGIDLLQAGKVLIDFETNTVWCRP